MLPTFGWLNAARLLFCGFLFGLGWCVAASLWGAVTGSARRIDR